MNEEARKWEAPRPAYHTTFSSLAFILGYANALTLMLKCEGEDIWSYKDFSKRLMEAEPYLEIAKTSDGMWERLKEEFFSRVGVQDTQENYAMLERIEGFREPFLRCLQFFVCPTVQEELKHWPLALKSQ